MNLDETLTLNQQKESAGQRLHDLYEQYGFVRNHILFM